MVVSDIIREASYIFYVSEEKLRGECRERRVLNARYALFKALKLRGRTYVQIGQWLGGKDHSTVINGVKNAEKLMEDDPSYLQKVERLANLTHADCQRDYSFKVAA